MEQSYPATFLEHRLKLRQLKAVLAAAEHLNTREMRESGLID
jgi:hypothetical protein